MKTQALLYILKSVRDTYSYFFTTHFSRKEYVDTLAHFNRFYGNKKKKLKTTKFTSYLK